MRSLTSRGLASITLAALLALAPLSASAAYADDEPVIAEVPVVVEEPPVVEEPAVVEEPSVVEEPAVVEGTDTPADPADVAPPEQSAPAARLAAAAASPSITVTRTSGYPIDLSVTGRELTASWTSPTGPTGAYYLYDLTTNLHLVNSYGSPSLTATLTSGHEYEAYFNNGSGVYAIAGFTFAPPAPSAAENLVATRLTTANGFALTWDAPTDNTDNPVTNYEIEISDGASSVFEDTTDLGYAADGLITGITYAFSVVAESADGQRSNGIVSSGHLLDTIAPTAPGVPVISLSGTTLSGSWTAPTYDGGYPIDYYVVELLADGDVIDDYSIDGLAFSAVAEYGVAYSFRVYASTADYYGAAATSNVVNSPADSAPAAPTAYGHSEWYYPPMIYMSWDLAPTSGSRIISFTTILRDASGAIVREVTELNPSSVDLTGQNFLDLPNDTDYTVSVIATNAAGSSPESNRFPVRTNGSTPPPFTPADIADSATYLAADSVTVTRDGDVLTAHVKNAEIGDWVFGYAYSSPTALGWVQVGAGNLARWNIGAAGLPAGTHTLAVMDRFGGLFGAAGFSLPATVSAAALATTGTDSTLWIAFGAGMLGLGALLMVRRRVRS